jgi:hypothetical protein
MDTDALPARGRRRKINVQIKEFENEDEEDWRHV